MQTNRRKFFALAVAALPAMAAPAVEMHQADVVLIPELPSISLREWNEKYLKPTIMRMAEQIEQNNRLYLRMKEARMLRERHNG
jgi:hypothetical protein